MKLSFYLSTFLASFALAKSPKVTLSSFKNQLTPFQYFEDTDVVLTTDPFQGFVFVSKDAGTTWDKAEGDAIQGEAIAAFTSPADNDVAVVLGRGTNHWITRDRAKHWHKFESELSPARALPLSFHASDSKKIILNTGFGRETQALYTDDGFKTVQPLREKALRCMWAKEKPNFTTGNKDQDKDRTLCLVAGQLSWRANAQRMLISDDYFENEEEPGLDDGRPQRGVVNMVSSSRYLVAARRSEATSEMALYSSQDSIKWNRAMFSQQKLEADGFTVMESTNYSIQVDIMVTPNSPFQRSPMGMLYTSNYNGTYFTKSEEYTNRNLLGFVDFEKIQSIQGITLSNIVSNGDDVLEIGAAKEVVSRITFNDGRDYQPLNADGKDLHLHSFTEIRNQGRVFSSKAPGLVMGVGNTGKYLREYEEGDLWVSQDAGVNWYRGLEGAHKYEFGDQGSILVAVYDEEPTNELTYSLDFGKNWESVQLGDLDVRAALLTTIPDSTSLKFLLSGIAPRGTDDQYSVYSIDFGALDMRQCKKKDFETWYAREDKGEPQCIMGHTQSFKRRKQDADCVIDKEGEEPEPDNKSKTCPCTEEDYECDFNFVRSKDGKRECKPVTGLLPPAGACKNQDDTYMGSSGYRLIPGNTCSTANEKDAKDALVERPCNSADNTPNGEIVSVVTHFSTDSFREYYYLEDSMKGSKGKNETIVMTTADRQLWVTHDHGKTWKEELKGEEVVAIYANRYESDNVYFITPSDTVYYSTDRAKKIEQFYAPSLPNTARLAVLKFHPMNQNWLIWTGCSDFFNKKCDPEAYVSLKNGLEETWTPLKKSVGTCEFMYQEGRNDEENLVYCVHQETEKRELISSSDWFAHQDVVFEDMLNFATMSEFVVIARREEEDRAFLKLDSSVDAKTFAHARFPPNFNVPHESAYTVLDSSTHAIFLHVTVNDALEQEYGTILKSNSNGTSYITSLPGVNRNREGYVDFEKTLGIEGAAVANVVGNLDDVNKGASKKLKTMITHNDGADWDVITPPKDDGERKYECDDSSLEKCSLHIHGYTERKNAADTYSSPTAIGLMMGVGNVGEYLGPKQDADTFISSDGGVSWRTAAKGQYMWEFGDQGSIIVIVEELSPTRTLSYSKDEGATWEDYEFWDEDMEVSDISTVPSDGSTKFILWGKDTGSKGRAMTIHLDFSGMYDGLCEYDDNDPNDPASDYYLWTPKHPMQDTNCLFGHEAEYHRKKLDRNCYNGPKVERLHSKGRDCECTRRDFECAYNYERLKDGTCKLVGEQLDPMQVCRDDPERVEYFQNTPYRRIPMDTCKGGKEMELTGSPQPCPGKGEEFQKKHGISGVALFFAIVLPIAAAAGIGYYVWKRFEGNFGRIQLGGGGGGSFDTSSPWLSYPVMAISAVVAGLMAVPMVVGSVVRSISERFGRGGYREVRPYRSRSSFATRRGNYASVGADESDLLGEDSEDEA
ncbi:MAG: vacuolar protein sorting/targeting protein PEP1 [Chrysothrix sp. TS-e1954]|nr:MAG: vacuolar protein sorting/targeting protein PEP1 [Chrysothrix sp. TS-e1954]